MRINILYIFAASKSVKRKHEKNFKQHKSNNLKLNKMKKMNKTYEAPVAEVIEMQMPVVVMSPAGTGNEMQEETEEP